MVLPTEVTAISYLAPWLPSDPLWNPRLSKRGPGSSASTSQTDMSKLSATGGNAQVFTIGCTEDSRATSWCPTLVSRATRKQRTCCPGAFGSSWSTRSRSLKRCWCATNVTVLRLLTTSLQRTAKALCKEQPGWPRVTNPNARLCSEEMNRQIVYIIFVLIKP